MSGVDRGIVGKPVEEPLEGALITQECRKGNQRHVIIGMSVAEGARKQQIRDVAGDLRPPPNRRVNKYLRPHVGNGSDKRLLTAFTCTKRAQRLKHNVKRQQRRSLLCLRTPPVTLWPRHFNRLSLCPFRSVPFRFEYQVRLANGFDEQQRNCLLFCCCFFGRCVCELERSKRTDKAGETTNPASESCPRCRRFDRCQNCRPTYVRPSRAHKRFSDARGH
jgi:hypothetical protein